MMETVRSYRDLKIWQMAIELVPDVYRLIQQLPEQETYALGNQIRRATVSIPANIAEGQARQHTREFIQHLAIARGSLAELDTLLVIAERLSYVKANDIHPLKDRIDHLRRGMHGMASALARKL